MEQNIKKESIFKKPWMQSLAAIVAIFVLLSVFIIWQSTKGFVIIEDSYLDAPIVNLSPSSPGTLNALYVSSGDYVKADTQIALVGSQIITTKEAGIIISAPDVIGQYFSPGQSVASLVKNQDMKVVGSIEETKGLADITAGEPVTFTVDAFPGKKYNGVVEKVSETSIETGVVFSISDKRPVKKFDVTVKFDVSLYPELKNGMSAKMTINTRK